MIRKLSEVFKSSELKSSIGLLLFNMLNWNILRTSRAIRISSFKTKNKKLIALSNTTKNKINAYDVPVINLSSIQLSDKELNQLSFGLDHSFVDKNKHVKKNLAANFESLAQAVNSEILNEEKEDLHEFLRAYCDIFTKNVYSTKDYTYSNLKRLIKDDTLVVIPGDKDSCVIIMDKVDYVTKMEEMIKNGIQKGVYVETEDNTLRDLKHFQDFLYRNFKNNEHYNKMYPTSNQPAQLYGTAKTHKHENIDEINVQSLNFRPIIAQTGTCTYNAAQVISNYLKPLYTCNEYIIGNTQDFSKLIQEQSPLQLDEEYVSYDIESLFTNVPITETIEYILDEIYVKNKLPKLCSRLIFKRLLLKLTTESTYMFNSKFYK